MNDIELSALTALVDADRMIMQATNVMLDRIQKLLRELEWCRYVRSPSSRSGKRIATCPSCYCTRYNGHAFPGCELKACLDELDNFMSDFEAGQAAGNMDLLLAKAEERKS